jgi:hypothetical protein
MLLSVEGLPPPPGWVCQRQHLGVGSSLSVFKKNSN